MHWIWIQCIELGGSTVAARRSKAVSESGYSAWFSCDDGWVQPRSNSALQGARTIVMGRR